MAIKSMRRPMTPPKPADALASQPEPFQEEPLAKQPPPPSGSPGDPISSTMPVGGGRTGGLQPAALPAQAASQPASGGLSPAGRTEGGKWNANYEWEGDDRPSMAPGTVGRMEGFNTGAWGSGERGSNSLKNTFGQMASNFNSDEGVSGVMAHPMFQAAFPNAQPVPGGKNDLIDFDGPGPEPPVDVIRGAGAEGSAWAWQPGNSGGAQDPGMQMQAFDQGGLPDDLMQMLAQEGGGNLEQIMAELEALQSGKGSNLEQEALLRELM